MAQQMAEAAGTGNGTSFANVVKQGRPTEGRERDVAMVHSEEAKERATKGKIRQEEAAKAESEVTKEDGNTQMVTKLLDKLNQKDEQISKMLATIEGPRIQIQTLNNTLTQMQTKGNEDI